MMNLTRETFMYGVLVFLVILTLINFVQYVVVYNNLDEFKSDPLKVSVQHVYDQNVRVYNYWKNLGGSGMPALKSVVAVAAVAAPFLGAAVVTYMAMDWYGKKTNLLSVQRSLMEY